VPPSEVFFWDTNPREAFERLRPDMGDADMGDDASLEGHNRHTTGRNHIVLFSLSRSAVTEEEMMLMSAWSPAPSRASNACVKARR
jgi:hypothetical protein